MDQVLCANDWLVTSEHAAVYGLAMPERYNLTTCSHTVHAAAQRTTATRH